MAMCFVLEKAIKIMEKQTMLSVLDPADRKWIEKYAATFKLEESGSTGLVINYVQANMYLGKWTEAKVPCLTVERVIKDYLQNNVFAAQQFALVQGCLDMANRCLPMEKEVDKWEMFRIFYTLLRANDTAVDARFESMEPFFKVANYGLEYLYAFSKEEVVNTMFKEYLEMLGRSLTSMSDAQRVKYGYKLMKIYKVLLRGTDQPQEWLFDLLLRFGQVVALEQGLEECDTRCRMEQVARMSDLIKGKLDELMTVSKKRKPGDGLDQRVLTKHANIWVRGLVHICHMVRVLHDDQKEKEQESRMYKRMDEILITKEAMKLAHKIRKEEYAEAEKRKKAYEKKFKNEDKLPITVYVNKSDEDIRNESRAKATSLFYKRKREGIEVYDQFSVKDKEELAERYIDKHEYGPMLKHCEEVLKKMNSSCLAIDEVCVIEMTRLISDIHHWEMNRPAEKKWVKKLAKWTYVPRQDVFTVFYGSSVDWSLKKEKRKMCG